MDKVKEILTRKMIISKPLQEMYLNDIKRHGAAEIVFYKDGIKIPSLKFFIEIKNEKLIIKMDGLDFITPVKRTYKLKDSDKLTGLFSENFDIKYF